VKALFITGTDTHVGKTNVTAALVRHLREQGRSVCALKPIATGGMPISEDTRMLAEVSHQSFEAVTRWTFPEPVAPSLATRLHGVKLTLKDLCAPIREANCEWLLVEGVGGLLCPLTATETVADWIAELNMPMLVVARRSLGTLNHTLMTLEVAHRRGLDVYGLIVNETAPVLGLAEETNLHELRRWISVPMHGVLPYTPPEQGPPRLVPTDGWDWLEHCPHYSPLM